MKKSYIQPKARFVDLQGESPLMSTSTIETPTPTDSEQRNADNGQGIWQY